MSTPRPAESRRPLALFRVFDREAPSKLPQLQPPRPLTRPEPSPQRPAPPAAAMSDEKQPSANLIRMWRVWRTTKEMMNDRVGCARACNRCECVR